MKKLLVGSLSAGSLVFGSALFATPAYAATPAPAVVVPPLVQVCIAANLSLSQVESTLDRLKDTGLIQRLNGLTGITLVGSDGVDISNAADLSKIRDVLGCKTRPGNGHDHDGDDRDHDRDHDKDHDRDHDRDHDKDKDKDKHHDSDNGDDNDDDDDDDDSDDDSGSDSTTPFANCTEVRAAGQDPISSDNARFQKSLDRDGDGVGCELNGEDDQVTVVPNDSPETGAGPAEDNHPVEILLGGFGIIALAGFAGRKVLSGRA
jgi:excalibur calcium-binding domain-containing protein